MSAASWTLESSSSYVPTTTTSSLSPTTTTSRRLRAFYWLWRACSVLCLFLAYDLLKGLHVVNLLWATEAITLIFLLLNQRPFQRGNGPELKLYHWSSIVRFGLLQLVFNLCWFYGLTLCGTLRTILVSEHPSSPLLIGLWGLFCHSKAKAVSGQSRTRGAVLFLFGIAALLLVDHDDNSPHHQAYHAGHASHHQEIYTIFTHMFSWTDISDHKGGVLILAILLLLAQGSVSWYGRKVGVSVGGAKRLQTLSALVTVIVLTPWAIMHRENLFSAFSSLFTVLTITFIAVCLRLGNIYLETNISARSDRYEIHRYGTLISFGVAFLLGTVWTQSVSFGVTADSGEEPFVFEQVEDHQMSPGVIFAAMLFVLASLNLTSVNRSGTHGVFVGYSPSGLPLYNLSSDSIHEAGLSLLRVAKSGLKQILDDTNSRRIFYFLLLNLFFTAVEFTYGIWTNSLGLISDGFHMLFDCSALVMGLYAAVLSRAKPTKTFSFGYDRLEILSGFVNGIFLAVIAFNVFVEGIRRLWDPPTVGTERLFAVSVSGLVVNLIGIAAFSGHSHGHSHGHGHSHSHGHSHNANMQGVFLHVLADTLGSVGVIVSSLLIEYYDLYIADPICSVFIAVLIFASVVPLIKDSTSVLVLSPSQHILSEMDQTWDTLPEKIFGVQSVLRIHLWPHTDQKLFANVALQADDSADVQMITEQVSQIFKSVGVQQVAVQVQKTKFAHHVEGLGTRFANGGSHFIAM